MSKQTITTITDRVIEAMSEWAEPAAGSGADSSHRCESDFPGHSLSLEFRSLIIVAGVISGTFVTCRRVGVSA